MYQYAVEVRYVQFASAASIALRACGVSWSMRLLFFEVPCTLVTHPLLSSSDMYSKNAGSCGALQ